MKADGAFLPKNKVSNQHSCVDIVEMDDVKSRELSQNSYKRYKSTITTLYFANL